MTMAAVIAAMHAAAAGAQQPPGEPIEPGIADRGPLSESLRIIQPGLAQPQQFEQIYRIIGPDGEMLMRASGGLYAVFPRSDYAVTRQGPLATVPPGTVFYIGSLPAQYLPQRPLGPLPEDLIIARRLDDRDAMPIDTQIDLEAPGEPYERQPLGRRAVRAIIPPVARDDGGPNGSLDGWPRETPDGGQDDSSSRSVARGTIVTDDAYRVRRVRELMLMAAAAERDATAHRRAGE